MSYQVLARKWRPQRFSQVVGQEHVLTALANGLESNRLHHAYLFSGTRGVGKTSIARLFAKGLNCERGVTAEPCGECENCKAIEEGRFIDLLEIDAASRTKVEDTRELLDNVQYKPVQGRYKIYLIDEVHMLSRHSFNALLKTLEEPPDYVKFLLATTDPHKLPITILSRCIQFHLKALDTQQIADHLEYLLLQEKIPYEFAALEQLAKAAGGSIRDSLSLTDQAIAMSKGNITAEIVHRMLGTLDSEQALDIIQALQLADGEALMRSIQQVADNGVEWDQLLQQVAADLHRIAMRQLLQPSAESADRLDFLARNLAPEDVQFYYQLMLNGRKELPFAPDQRSGVEMTMLRALAFHPKLLRFDKYTEASEATQTVKAEQADKTADHLNRIRQQLPQQETAAVRASSQLDTETELQPPHISAKVQTPSAVEAGAKTAAAAESVQSAVQPVNDIAEADSPALRALRARQQLQKKNRDSRPVVEYTDKLNIVPASVRPSLETAVGKNDKSLELMERLSRISAGQQPPISQPAVAVAPEEDSERLPHDETDAVGEDYHWQWLNPELEEESGNRLRPSDIKQAILQERTPELVAKVLKLSAERDHWSNVLEQLALSGMVKQLGLNSLLLQHDEDSVTLGLRPEQSNLNNVRYINVLQQRLSTFYQREVRLNVVTEADPQRLTPLEQRRLIYQELSDQAREMLQQDPQIHLLQQEFDAVLEPDSIRPVG
ncbi:DNA polymerase III subunit gamma/tau [Chelonobacter oris]|uniref:DNA polymerase III subunit gamma/tau n=1 Tax=Chelonobacter oris TaxID=505317 RepID=UPI00244AE811|nr:DNA polymerase III subunit gamma/tau [Chelonobacter oris]MDH2999176.1 DNA polymerase III subunit gamma/tau [Chelonobacter oris]